MTFMSKLISTLDNALNQRLINMFSELIDKEMKKRGRKIGIKVTSYEITAMYFAGPDLEITGDIEFTGTPKEEKFSKSKSLVLYGDGTFYFNTIDPEILEAINDHL